MAWLFLSFRSVSAAGCWEAGSTAEAHAEHAVATEAMEAGMMSFCRIGAQAVRVTSQADGEKFSGRHDAIHEFWNNRGIRHSKEVRRGIRRVGVLVEAFSAEHEPVRSFVCEAYHVV